MDHRLEQLLADNGGVATRAQLLTVMSRRGLEFALKTGQLERIWQGLYSRPDPSPLTRLRALDHATGTRVAVCMGTAAALYGFDTEDTRDLHILNPPRHQLRSARGLVVHRREGAPLNLLDGRLVTTPAWTAVETACASRRPRALAILDAALRSGTCTRQSLVDAAMGQAGRRGIVAVRDLIPLADGRAESPMESESRLVMIDGGLTPPELQYDFVDLDGNVWRLDFAWPDQQVAVEYDGFEWHSSPAALARDRQKRAAVQELGWRYVAIIADDVRRQPDVMLRRIDTALRLQAA